MSTFKPLYVLFALLVSVSTWAQAADSYSRLYIFGDSLSDTGNLASLIGAFPPPYYMNRVSNGPVAMDVLAQKLGLDASASLHLIGPAIGSNYAVAGASASGFEAIDLDNQLLLFRANHGNVAPQDALYVVFVGGNDIRAARSNPDPVAAHARVADAAARARQAIVDLADIGARHFLVINSPNIGLIPETSLLAEAFDEPKLDQRSRKLSQRYRQALHRAVTHLRHPGKLDITEFDLYTFFNQLVRHAHRFGFSNSTDACFSSQSLSFHPDCLFGQNFDDFIFFNEIHPTARVHALVGEAFYQSVDREQGRKKILPMAIKPMAH